MIDFTLGSPLGASLNLEIGDGLRDIADVFAGYRSMLLTLSIPFTRVSSMTSLEPEQV